MQNVPWSRAAPGHVAHCASRISRYSAAPLGLQPVAFCGVGVREHPSKLPKRKRVPVTKIRGTESARRITILVLRISYSFHVELSSHSIRYKNQPRTHERGLHDRGHVCNLAASIESSLYWTRREFF